MPPESRDDTQARFEASFGSSSKVNARRSLRDAHHALSLPLLVRWLFLNDRIHPAYGATHAKMRKLARRLYQNTRRIQTGVSYRAHLAMAAKLMETPPETEGAVVECGCWVGGSSANLSLICDFVDRDLIIYDSFEGLPAAESKDKFASPDTEGFFRGDLEVVQDNVRRYGAIDRVQFRKGWFSDTLPHHTEPIALASLDVDYQSSLHDCVVNLWPHLVEKGHMFIDEYMIMDYCALFFSERFWKQYFNAPPPGLMGVGTGVGVGQYFLGPFDWSVDPTSIAYTRKDFYGLWDYERDDDS